ncbi:iron chelate uptake ABC transporter family permease subunit [Pseudomonas sichuanensis]|uniref:iron chelate uptake ABC transporter family permease subunit n=1 Tax=Pseudomonas sichuanensis TaxID=2213015 RepID=UPI0024489385|nr:iron chelate uptake ABC transporter family permease subunit [Pseudomonas sichuanensis]MDH0730164.1 iron chelate uptake ABC transporter family permease subunit [Pseudomonas sichuanensis]MDH1581252.1 iron chelate uptake ABC transporter family permease subunit [Pseudomonas sichuanensis]MDH1593413.1 iron chelate uptake ABC transporter family permease subunit [Pseudomonas sichuanensis]MDH1597168.1 iron chelate uptake ABC transporter family permease subunit [Pseudomonas sichuanensis]
MLAKPGVKLALLGVLCLVAVYAFMTLEAYGLWEYVLPFRAGKLAVMIVVAYCVAVSSVIFQTITQNNILSPSVMGFDSLYILIQALGILLYGQAGMFGENELIGFVANTLIMSIAATALFRWVAPKNAQGIHMLLLMGIVFSLLFKSLTGFVMRMINPNDFMLLQGLMFANFNSLHAKLIPLALVLVAAGTLIFWICRWQYDVVALGRETAIGLGVNYSRTVIFSLVGVSILVSVSTALVGPVTFLGVLVSNLAYWVMKDYRHRLTVPAAFFCAVLCLVGGQTLLEHVFALRLPISAVIEFSGGILFIILVMKRLKK